MTASSRIMRGITANLAAIGTRILVQFATFPILFASWSVEVVGIWLILFAIPSYVAIFGNAFAGAGGTAALAAAQAGDIEKARRDFLAAWTISAGSTAALGLAFAGCAMFLIPSVIETGSVGLAWDAAQAAAWLALYVFATSQMGIFDVPFRVVGRYPDHLFLYNGVSLFEIVILAAAVTFSQGIAMLAMSLALYRCIAAVVIYFSARKAAPQIFARGHGPLNSSASELWRPSLAFIMMPLVFGLNLQGYLLLVGAVFGAVILATFSATRVLTRLLDLTTGLTYAMQFYESGYLDGDRLQVQRRMLSTMTLVSFALSAGFALALLLLGPWLQDFFTMGETAFDPKVAMVLVCASTIRALASAPIAIEAAANDHSRVVTIYLAGSAFGLLLATILGFAGASLPLVLTPLLLAELSQLIPALRQTLGTLQLSWREFVGSLISRERLDDVAALWHLLRSRV